MDGPNAMTLSHIMYIFMKLWITHRSKRSVGEGRQSVIMNLMKVVDESLLEVREFLDEAENFEEEEENTEENTVVLLMKAVDKG